jgi:homocysteine S-methyltransferase
MSLSSLYELLPSVLPRTYSLVVVLVAPPGSVGTMARSNICLKDILLDRNDTGAISSSADGIRRILVLDGGVSTHLESLLALSCRDEDRLNDKSTTSMSGPTHSNSIIRPSFPHRELWSSSLLLTDQGRRTIRQGHFDWILAGADILSTVTYQCHYNRTRWSEALQSSLTVDTMDDMWRVGISLAREAADQASNFSERRVFVAASLGCYGASLANGAEYTGDYGEHTMENLMYFHQRKLEQAVLNRPDAVAFETIPSLLECQALARLLIVSHGILTPPTTEGCDRPCACWISLACRNGDELNDGTPVETALEALDDIPLERVQGFGFNCCDSLHLPVLVGHWLDFEMRKCRDRRRALVLYPNSGETWSADNGTWIPGSGSQSTKDFCNELWKCVDVIGKRHQEAKESADQLQSLVLVLGGCCRTSPACVASLRQRVDQNARSVARAVNVHCATSETEISK